MNEKITPELFNVQATTGLVTKESPHWRYQMLTIDVKRSISKEYIQEAKASGLLSNRLKARAQAKAIRTLDTRDFVEGLITTGKHREHINSIVEELDIGDDERDEERGYELSSDGDDDEYEQFDNAMATKNTNWYIDYVSYFNKLLLNLIFYILT